MTDLALRFARRHASARTGARDHNYYWRKRVGANWAVENGLHWIRLVTYDEERS